MTSEAPQILHIARHIVPESARLDADGERRFVELVDEALAGRDPSMRRQLALFLRVLEWLPLLRFGARLSRLAPARQVAALRYFESHSLSLLRMGFWGVKTLCFIGYYGRSEIGPTLSYTPSKDGNPRLRHV